MADFVKTLKSCSDSDPARSIQIDLRLVPRESYLYKLLSEQSSIPVKKDETNAFCVTSTFEELQILRDYLHLGTIDSQKVAKCVEVLDYYTIFSLKASYPEEFVKIKLEEEWFRTNLHKQNLSTSGIHDNLFRCITLTDNMLKSFMLMSNVHYLYSKIPSFSHKKYDDCFSHLINKERNEDEYLSYFEQELYLIHSFPRFYVKFTDYDELNSKIKEVNSMFLNRDLEFANSCIRENLRIDRGKSPLGNQCYKDVKSLKYLKTTLPLNWENTLHSMIERFNSSCFWGFLNTIPNFWDGILLAGKSVLNLILDCQLKAVYNLFFYGISQDQVNSKIRSIIELFVDHSDLFCLSVSRTQNFITLNIENGHCECIEIRCVLGLYSSISEILHSLNIDCSCVGFDGTNFYMTERSKFAISNMMNFVDFDRMCPTYEFLLAKYGSMGFSTFIPNFKWNPEISEPVKLREHLQKQTKNKVDKIKNGNKFPQLEGLDVLLYSYFGNKPTKYYTTDYKVLGSETWISWANFTFELDPQKNIISYTINFRFECQPDCNYPPEYEKIMIDNILELNPISLNETKVKEFFELVDETPDFNPVFTEYKFKLPMNLELNTTLPREQITSKFHKLVLEDISSWYKSRFVESEYEADRNRMELEFWKDLKIYKVNKNKAIMEKHRFIFGICFNKIFKKVFNCCIFNSFDDDKCVLYKWEAVMKMVRRKNTAYDIIWNGKKIFNACLEDELAALPFIEAQYGNRYGDSGATFLNWLTNEKYLQ